jgi:hypothetical protein
MNAVACFLLSLASVLALTSCAGGHHSSTQAVHRVYLLDCSASITPQALEDAVHQIELQADQMQRGDRISVIPITSDSDTNAQGNILRMTVPLKRQPYDHDLQAFRKTFRQAVHTLHDYGKAHRYNKTDILGSIDLAAQEFAPDDEHIQKRLIVLSDLIEEDETLDFRTAPALAGENSARQLASRLAKNVPQISTVSVFLGSLQSNELDQLPKVRRQAIREFWLEYFKNEKTHPVFATDGPGMSASFTNDGR